MNLFIGEDENGKPIGYGLVSYDKFGEAWISGGLLPEARSRGYGRMLFSFLADQGEKPVCLEVFAWNIPAKNLYLSLGFMHVFTTGSVLTMRRN